MARVAPLTDIDFTVDEMMKHVARFKEQKSTSKSFIDTQIPGHERDIFSIIGAGVLEDPDLKPSIPAQDFHLSIVKGRARKRRKLALASDPRSVHAFKRPLGHLLGTEGRAEKSFSSSTT